MVLSYFFYKNIAFTLTILWYNLYTGYSASRLYDDWFQSTYNLFFTSLPVVCVGILDQDISGKTSMSNPQLYKAGPANVFFSAR